MCASWQDPTGRRRRRPCCSAVRRRTKERHRFHLRTWQSAVRTARVERWQGAGLSMEHGTASVAGNHPFTQRIFLRGDWMEPEDNNKIGPRLLARNQVDDPKYCRKPSVETQKRQILFVFGCHTPSRSLDTFQSRRNCCCRSRIASRRGRGLVLSCHETVEIWSIGLFGNRALHAQGCCRS